MNPSSRALPVGHKAGPAVNGDGARPARRKRRRVSRLMKGRAERRVLQVARRPLVGASHVDDGPEEAGVAPQKSEGRALAEAGHQAAAAVGL